MGSMKELFRHIKVNFFLPALVYLVLGVILTIWPHTSSTVICVGFGLFLLVYGIVTLVTIFLRSSRSGQFQFEMILGILFAGLGIFFLLRSDVVLSFLPVVIGIYIVIDALLNLKRAQELYRMGYVRWWITLVTSLISAALGILILWNPLFLSDFIFRMVGIVLIYTGVSDLVALFTVGHITRDWLRNNPADPID